MNYTGQTSFADMFEYYCTRNVTNEREYNEREMMRWLKQQLQQAHRAAEESAKDAYRRGWERAKREAEVVVRRYETKCQLEDLRIIDRCGNAIASMEYKGAENDQTR